MPYCTRCGTKSEGKFCPNCGAAMNTNVSSAPGYSQGGGQPGGSAPSTPGYGFIHKNEQPRTGASYAPNYNQNQRNGQPDYGADPKNYKLGWHKFLIYLNLWAVALLSFANGVIYCVIGIPYALLGVLDLFLGVYAIYVRFQLARFKQGAPKKLTIFGVILIASNLLAAILLSDPEAGGAVVWNVAFIFYSWRYYSSREELFVN